MSDDDTTAHSSSGRTRWWVIGATALVAVVAGVAIGLMARSGSSTPEPAAVRALLAPHGVTPLLPAPEADPALVDLGRALFFDPILSGNRNISCATCHHPSLASGDGLSLSIGSGGEGLGTDRQLAEGGLIPRNAPEVYNRGQAEWTTMFWDSRVNGTPETGFVTPAEEETPEVMDSAVAAQALFPVTSPGEMRGFRGDEDVNGDLNEIAEVDSEDFTGMWAALTARLLEIDEYRELFAAAYPAVPADEIDFHHAANAIGAFEVDAFTFVESPFNRFLEGDDAAISDPALRGAGLFYGKATCATCHTGPLLTDQQTHAIAVPQVGPGKSEEAPEDHGRGRETFAQEDMYAFRTPPLHNVAITGPWTHDGAFSSLEAVIRHHMDPEASLRSYDPAQTVGPAIYFLDPEQFIQRLIDAIDPALAVPNLSDNEIADLIAFLEALTDPAAAELEHLIPDRVPSGLPLDR